jgi:hypothetical protein
MFGAYCIALQDQFGRSEVFRTLALGKQGNNVFIKLSGFRFVHPSMNTYSHIWLYFHYI